MIKNILVFTLSLLSLLCKAQTNPVITSWLQNNSVFGKFYTAATGGTAQTMTVLANCQQVRYSSTSVYINTTGIPAYPTGIFTGDGNPNVAGNQNAIYKLPLSPTQNTGTPTATSSGNCGIFINGVSLFDYRDGVAWDNTNKRICGGPGNPTCSGTIAWNRDAIPAEKLGFDCAKGHPAGTNYHHHQNPSAFKYDSKTSNSYSSICDTYNSEGLYTIDATKHSPLIGFAYDGFPIYGAYGYKNVNGTGGITRMKSSYSLSTNTTRTNGPNINAVSTDGKQTFFNGYFREDYVYTATTANTPDYLDEHNGRFCVTPEYPAGIYCYFATVNEFNTSVYPYVIGPTFYGNVTGSKVTSVTETTTKYTSVTSVEDDKGASKIDVYPNPSSDFIAVQIVGLNTENLKVELLDLSGKLLMQSTINQGTTTSILDTRLLYAGNYFVKITGTFINTTKGVVIVK